MCGFQPAGGQTNLQREAMSTLSSGWYVEATGRPPPHGDGTLARSCALFQCSLKGSAIALAHALVLQLWGCCNATHTPTPIPAGMVLFTSSPDNHSRVGSSLGLTLDSTRSVSNPLAHAGLTDFKRLTCGGGKPNE